MTRIRKKTIKAISWNGIGAIVDQVVLSIVAVMLTRMLDQSDFGQLNMIAVITGFAALFKDFGFGQALIQRKNLQETHKSSTFWINVLIGVILTTVIYYSAPGIARFYNIPALEPMTRVLSVVFFISSLNIVQGSLLRKQLKFKKLSFINITSSTLGGILAVILAFLGFGVWALIYRSLFKVTARTLLLWTAGNWRPRFLFNTTAIKELGRFGVNLTATNFISYLANKLDVLLIGKMLGDSSLGLYNRGGRFQRTPVKLIKRQIGAVVFPALSHLNDQPKKQVQIYLQLSGLLTMIMFPVLVGLFCVAEEFVIILFQKKWAGLIPLFKIFSLGSIFTTIGFPGSVFLIKDRTGLQLKLTTYTRIIRIVGVLIGISFGTIEAVAIAVVSTNMIGALVMNISAMKVMDISGIVFLRTFLPVSLICAVMAIVVLTAEHFYFEQFKNEIEIILKTVTGVIVYVGLLAIFRPRPVPFLIENYWPPKRIINKIRNR